MKQKNNEQLCPKCQTGYDTYLLDNKNPLPVHSCHNGTSCAMFKPLKKIQTESVRLIKNPDAFYFTGRRF
ncbi:MAG: hypothetical protein ACLS27_08715 [Eubacterium sp.]